MASTEHLPWGIKYDEKKTNCKNQKDSTVQDSLLECVTPELLHLLAVWHVLESDNNLKSLYLTKN